jgi:hypothetical protein
MKRKFEEKNEFIEFKNYSLKEKTSILLGQENFIFLNREQEIINSIYYFIRTLWTIKCEMNRRAKYTIFAGLLICNTKTKCSVLEKHILEKI